MERSILVVGEAIVDLHPTGPDRYGRRLGGAPANVAVGLARLGRRPALWARLGTGPFGSFLSERLSAENVDPTWLVRDAAAPTGCAVVSLDDAGDRSFTLYLDNTANTRLDPATVTQLPLDRLDWLHVGGVELAHEPARSAVLRLLRAVGPDVTVSFDPNYRASLWERFDYRATLDRVLPATDVVVASPADLVPAGWPGEATTLAEQLVADGPHTAFVTRGADGAVARATGDPAWGPATAAHDGFAAAVTDTTGAGDAFTAGVIYELSGEPDTPADSETRLTRAVAVGNAVATRSVEKHGATTGLPDAATVRRLLDE